tara:strand:- start:55 stop:222 length:168 start_codon:yes stop_codon:yes gene_type:complete
MNDTVIREKQPAIELMDEKELKEYAELTNGRLAMIGFVAAVGAYLVTGDIIPGIL